MRSQEEEEVFAKWRSEDSAWENQMIEDQMRADRAMEDARNEMILDAQISAFLSGHCESIDGNCNTEYYCTPEGEFACKKCNARTPT